ncbi:MAG: hypothetical protein EZS28_054581 [Streblomastix strix]|uniref:HECT domain-containing protein n=1 Tax=Streblomastix strix TaxID=222440 RepID=A0A5J4QIS9_9EUKA|nr:MAG: hypothetical protein EZS28_054581 [Streblomastix strix]
MFSHDVMSFIPSTFEQLISFEAKEWMLPMKINFRGEKVIDVGGPKREFFWQFIQAAVDESGCIGCFIADPKVVMRIWRVHHIEKQNKQCQIKQ